MTELRSNLRVLIGGFWRAFRGVEFSDAFSVSGDGPTATVEIDLSGKADLVDGTVPASQLPSYVDDVIEVANYAALPTTGESGKIYVAIDTGTSYRWSGSAYVEMGSISVYTFEAAALTNPHAASISPRRCGDLAINVTSLEVWLSNASTAAAAAWNMVSAGIYGNAIVASFDTPTSSGFYHALATATNAPSADEAFVFQHLAVSTGTTAARQIAFGLSTGKRYSRTKAAGAWGSWSTGVTPTEIGYLSGVTSSISSHITLTQPAVANVALTATETTVTPTHYVTHLECTVAAGLFGNLRLINPGAVAGYVLWVSVTFEAGSWVTIYNQASGQLEQDYAATARTYNYKFVFNGTAWVNRTAPFVRWRRWELDYTLQSTVNITADGTYSIGGSTHTFASYANLYSGFTWGCGNTSGTGVKLPAQGSSVTWATNGANHTFPVLYTSLPADLKYGAVVRVAASLGVTSADTGVSMCIGIRHNSVNCDRHVYMAATTAGVLVNATGYSGHTYYGSLTDTGGRGAGVSNIIGFDSRFPWATGKNSPMGFLPYDLIDLDQNWNWDEATTAGVSTTSGGSISYNTLSNYSLALSCIQATPAVGGGGTIRKVVVEWCYPRGPRS